MHWLLQGPPQRLRALRPLLAHAAHTPWRLSAREVHHILAAGWTVSQLVHIVAIVAHTLSLCSLVQGLQLPMEMWAASELPPTLRRALTGAHAHVPCNRLYASSAQACSTDSLDSCHGCNSAKINDYKYIHNSNSSSSGGAVRTNTHASKQRGGIAQVGKTTANIPMKPSLYTHTQNRHGAHDSSRCLAVGGLRERRRGRCRVPRDDDDDDDEEEEDVFADADKDFVTACLSPDAAPLLHALRDKAARHVHGNHRPLRGEPTQAQISELAAFSAASNLCVCTSTEAFCVSDCAARAIHADGDQLHRSHYCSCGCCHNGCCCGNKPDKNTPLLTSALDRRACNSVNMCRPCRDICCPSCRTDNGKDNNDDDDDDALACCSGTGVVARHTCYNRTHEKDENDDVDHEEEEEEEEEAAAGANHTRLPLGKHSLSPIPCRLAMYHHSAGPTRPARTDNPDVHLFTATTTAALVYTRYCGVDHVVSEKRTHRTVTGSGSRHLPHPAPPTGSLWSSRFNWRETGSTLMEQYYPGAALLLTEELDSFTDLTEQLCETDCVSIQTAPTTPTYALASLQMYVMNLLGCMQEGYPYSAINTVLQRPAKWLAQTLTTRPESLCCEDVRQLYRGGGGAETLCAEGVTCTSRASKTRRSVTNTRVMHRRVRRMARFCADLQLHGEDELVLRHVRHSRPLRAWCSRGSVASPSPPSPPRRRRRRRRHEMTCLMRDMHLGSDDADKQVCVVSRAASFAVPAAGGEEGSVSAAGAAAAACTVILCDGKAQTAQNVPCDEAAVRGAQGLCVVSAGALCDVDVDKGADEKKRAWTASSGHGVVTGEDLNSPCTCDGGGMNGAAAEDEAETAGVGDLSEAIESALALQQERAVLLIALATMEARKEALLRLLTHALDDALNEM